MREKTKDLLDYIFSAICIVVIFYLYFKVSETAAIYLTLAFILLILLSYVPQIKSLFGKVKYKDLIAELKKYELVREEELVENSTMTRDQIHQDIYHLSKKWDFKPLILFHSSYYLYVSSGIVEDLLKMLKEVSSKKRKLKEVLKNMMEEYGFKSKKEATDVIGHLRKHMD